MGPAYRANLDLAVSALGELAPDQWQAEPILARLKETAESRAIKLGDLMQPIRVALTGDTVSEPVNELLVVVGRETSLERLTAARAEAPS
jgi:glutamyl/glutaminyl-tRNA synthetase